MNPVKSVLLKLGVDLSTRNLDCQDSEYTTCELDELEKYIELYNHEETSISEKQILGCYFLECLNEYVQLYDHEHPLQNLAFKYLHSGIEIHESELDYWTRTTGNDEEDLWPIAKYIHSWQKKNI